MILMYTAQQLGGFNTFEQGAGAVNIEGAVRLARLVRMDLAGASLGDPLLTTATVPLPRTTIAEHTFSWSQGIILNWQIATGKSLISHYQDIYRPRGVDWRWCLDR